MTGRVLVITGQDSESHRAPEGHPETAARVHAVLRGAARVDGVEFVEGRLADPLELERVHTADHVARIRELSEREVGWIDADTFVSNGTYGAALGAAGASLTAVERLSDDPGGPSAFVVTRPPGHHAHADEATGFCLFNNIAVAAATLIDAGERVAILDWDVHHGNGTQQIFWSDPRVLYVSLHQDALYPGTGFPHERGPMTGPLTTVNLPLPRAATGDQYLRLLDEVVEPIVARFAPDWVLVSCGFDAHIDDPLAEMGLEARDFGLFTSRALSWAPHPARTVLYLEGGYHLAALESSTEAVVSVLADNERVLLSPTVGGPGAERVDELISFWSTR